MYNWSTDEKSMVAGTEQHSIWKIEQLINFGLNGEKLRKQDIKRFWSKLRLDPARKKFISLLISE